LTKQRRSDDTVVSAAREIGRYRRRDFSHRYTTNEHSGKREGANAPREDLRLHPSDKDAFTRGVHRDAKPRGSGGQLYARRPGIENEQRILAVNLDPYHR
jgi:hypothetical protein